MYLRAIVDYDEGLAISGGRTQGAAFSKSSFVILKSFLFWRRRKPKNLAGLGLRRPRSPDRSEDQENRPASFELEDLEGLGLVSR